MKKILPTLLILFTLHQELHSQYADLGTGNLKNTIWWFDWNNFTIANGSSKTITTADGLTVTITFSNVQGPVLTPSIMNTWYGSVLHYLYDFSDPNIKPALYSPYTTQNSQFTVTISAKRSGIPTGFKFIAADAEASAVTELTTLTTNGSTWKCIDFFRNSSQNTNPFSGCNTNTAIITDTYGGSAGIGQNPVIATDASTGSLIINCLFDRSGIEGQMGIAFGIFSSVDRGDLPQSYGYVSHGLNYTNNNPCNYQAPLPTLTQTGTLKLGAVEGDPDAIESLNDNSNGADEDGIISFPNYDKSGTYNLPVNLSNITGNNAYLTGWFDYNRNGVFDNNEFVTNTISNNATSSILTWTGLPANLAAGTVSGWGFRLRLSSDKSSTQNAAGYAPNGEVEDYLVTSLQLSVPDFIIPDTVCVNSPVNIINTSTNATTSYWNFCSGSLNSTPTGNNFASPSFSMPVFMDIVQEGANFYAFVVNHTGSLARMSFGNSLLNTPSITDLGSFGGIIPPQAEGIQIQNDGNSWIGYIIGGQYANSRLLKLNFGASLANIPTATNLGNIGGLDYPVDFTLVKDGTNWYGFTVSADNNTITRFSFGNSLDNIPVATNLGNIGGLNYPVGLFLIKNTGNYYLFITNRNSHTVSRLDFGSLITNTPTGINLGDPGNNFNWPRDINIITDCDKIFGFVTNEGSNSITRLDFNNNILSIPSTTDLGNIGNLSFPSSISKIFRTGDAVNFLAPNVTSNSVSIITFSNCNASLIPSYQGQTPPVFQYSKPGTYNVSLFIDEGLPTQTSICKPIVVIDKPDIDFNYTLNPCSPLNVQFNGLGNGNQNILWNFGDGTTITGNQNPVHNFSIENNYTISYTASLKGCFNTIAKTINISTLKDDIINTKDTTVCYGATKQLLTKPALSFCWNPSTYLNDPNSPNPITSSPKNITYYYTAEVTGNNLIINGDFSQGNTGFSSGYQYANPNTTEGQYFIGSNPQNWNATLSACADHTGGNGNMMLVNGSPVLNVDVWKQTVTVTPNTNYAFSTWLQALWTPNPAQLQFSINGKDIGTLITASLPTCTMNRFFTTWNSGSNTSATISIINKNNAIQGNDFALDDISFAPVFLKTDSVKIIIDTPSVKTSNDTTVCEGINVQLNTTGASSYSWGPSSGLNNLTIANPVAAPTTTTQFIVTGTTIKGCKASDTVNITIYPKPVINITANDSICKKSSVQLSASGGITYLWSPPTGLNNPSIANPVAIPASDTKYFVTVTNTNSCTNKDSIKISIYPDPIFTITPSVAICEKESIELKADGGNSYTWQPNQSLNNLNIPNPLATPLQTTSYSVNITNTKCNTAATLTTLVTIKSLPKVTASKSNDIDCSNDKSQLKADGANSYIWTPANSLNNPTIFNPVASPQSDTKYTVKGIDTNGCSNLDTVTVKFLSGNTSNYLMPNAFTPNNDGLNDCYGIKYWGVIKELEFSIYNRWGERVYYTKNPNDCWDGTYKRVMQKLDIYVYVVKAKTFCGDVYRKGTFTLIR